MLPKVTLHYTVQNSELNVSQRSSIQRRRTHVYTCMYSVHVECVCVCVSCPFI